MSESCTIVVVNQSGRNIDKIIMCHGTDSDTLYIPPIAPVLGPGGLPAGVSTSATVPLSPSMVDYWGMFVLFHGDGTVYVMVGDGDAPYKEFEVSNGTTLTFTLSTYLENSTNQGMINIMYSANDSDSANLYNSTTAAIVSPVGEVIQELFSAASE